MSSLKRLHQVDKQSKLTVSGYVRLKHKSLFKNNQYVLFQNIPISISLLCTLYYYLYDYFDVVSHEIQLSNGEKTI